ncbi:MAG: nucleotidyltransferase domain-containing protein [Candidatus Coatesbacteria bacterium]|nr:nucleotidyltransferase domain-containing protein [Candidatus Coatesbacteria bacterium]
MAVIDDLILRRARAALSVIARQARVRAAFLFGSYVEGEPDEFSDIDIAAFVEGAGQWGLTRRVEAAVEAQREVGDDIELHFFAAELLENPPKASFAAYVQSHGVPIDI